MAAGKGSRGGKKLEKFHGGYLVCHS
jgi:hypothetical protein